MIFNMGTQSYPPLPSFTYTGEYELLDDGHGRWRVRFLTSGTLIFSAMAGIAAGIDLFLVGSGAGATDYTGGGAGETLTVRRLRPQAGEAYEITVAAATAAGKDGAASSAFGYSAPGGKHATDSQRPDGGSGGGTYIWSSASAKTLSPGGSDGSDGGGSSETCGRGQGRTTREFGEAAGALYAGGGAGVAVYGGSNTRLISHGGEGGGGDSGTSKGASGVNGKGGGGGAPHGAGGSGIAIIRNARGGSST